MDWYDVDDVLYDGNEQEILRLTCPDCGGSIAFAYYADTASFEVTCKRCGHFSRDSGAPRPNCAVLLGDTATIGVTGAGESPKL